VDGSMYNLLFYTNLAAGEGNKLASWGKLWWARGTFPVGCVPSLVGL
jgi:hypothetical protein